MPTRTSARAGNAERAERPERTAAGPGRLARLSAGPVVWGAPAPPRPGLALAVFDFDGTLSWLRHGWPDLMLEVLRRRLPPRAGENPPRARSLLMDIVLGMNGRPTLMQMTRFAALVRARGGPAVDPEALCAEYQDRLDRRIAARMARLRSGRARPDDFVVFGARRLLDHLRREALTVSILSTTPAERVREEASILGLAPFFGPRIYGGHGDAAGFSKIAVLRRLLRDAGLPGDRLIAFGDGPVEIADTRTLGGLAVGVCSDEHRNGSGRMHAQKRRRLLDAGAHAVIPDFRDAIELIQGWRGA